MKRKKKPVTVQRGSVFVKIYSRRKQDRTYYQMSDYSSGRRQLRSFVSLKKAKKEALSVADKISRGEVAALSLTNKDRSAYVRARQNLKPSGMPLEIATLHYAEAFKILGGDKLIEAAKFYASRGMSKLARKTVQQVITEFLTAKKQRVASTEASRGLAVWVRARWQETSIWRTCRKRGLLKMASAPGWKSAFAPPHFRKSVLTGRNILSCSKSKMRPRKHCRDANGTEPWACCDCDCTRKLEQRLELVGEPFLKSLKNGETG